MPSGTLGFLNVQAISKAVFDKDFTFFTFTIASYLGRKNVPLLERVAYYSDVNMTLLIFTF